MAFEYQELLWEITLDYGVTRSERGALAEVVNSMCQEYGPEWFNNHVRSIVRVEGKQKAGKQA